MSVSVFSVSGQQAAEPASLSWPACALQGLPWAERQQQRTQAIAALGLESPDSIPPWDEAAQLAAQFLNVPIAVVTLVHGHTEYFRAACGLSSLGVGNPLSQQRHLALEQGLGLYVLDSAQPLVLSDTTDNAATAQSELVMTYGIRAYCGVPLMTAEGLCIGTLAVMDRHPRDFSPQDLGFMTMAARWGMSEYERQHSTDGRLIALSKSPSPLAPDAPDALADVARLSLLSQMTQDMRSPLTTVLGMTTMLSREIYGPLTPKQREYTDIVHRSSQTLMALVEEIIDLTAIEAGSQTLVPTSVDIAALGRQVMTALTPLADESAQTLNLTVEPGENHWILDQRTVKQIFYHLIFSVMQVAGENSSLCVHACRRGRALALVVWLANPWLGEGLPAEVIEVYGMTDDCAQSGLPYRPVAKPLLGLVLSQRLAQHHGGHIRVQGAADSGCRLVVVLPMLEAINNRSEVATTPAEALPSLG